jgi:DNA-binding NtrC family response regulator
MGIMGQPQALSRTVLIVEDDADQRWLTATLLQDNGLETVECESAEAALATMLLRGREICMVFADLRLSGVMDGIDLARELKMRWPHLRVVLTSGNPSTRLVHLPPGVEFMPKPWQPRDLLIAAERARSDRTAEAAAPQAAPLTGSA